MFGFVIVSLLAGALFASLALLFLLPRTLVRHVPIRKTSPKKQTLETMEWVGNLMDKLYVFLHDEFADDLKSLICQRVVTLLEERDYARSVQFDLVSFGDSVPKISAVDVIVSTPSQLVLDLEVEYVNGNAQVGFSADIPIAKGRTLPCEMKVKDLRFVTHLRMALSAVSLASDLDKPTVLVDLTCLSEPSFSFQLHTRVGSRYCLRNCPIVPFLVRRVLLKVITKKILYPNVLTKKVALPRWGFTEIPTDSEGETSEDDDLSESSDYGSSHEQ